MKVKKNPKTLITHLQISKEDLHNCLEEYLKEYAEYGEDSLSEDLIGIISALEHAIVHLQIARIECGADMRESVADMRESVAKWQQNGGIDKK